jgi:hypothetical protein
MEVRRAALLPGQNLTSQPRLAPFLPSPAPSRHCSSLRLSCRSWLSQARGARLTRGQIGSGLSGHLIHEREEIGQRLFASAGVR